MMRGRRGWRLRLMVGLGRGGTVLLREIRRLEPVSVKRRRVIEVLGYHMLVESWTAL